MNIERAFEILEIEKTASYPEAKQAYRDLASIWHPDRHVQNSRLAQKASHKMKELNAAFDLVTSYYSDLNKSQTDKESKVEKKIVAIKCRNCDTLNFIQEAPGIRFLCRQCNLDLFSGQTEYNNENRILCGDGRCIGVIYNGRCSVCGKTFEEGRNAYKDNNNDDDKEIRRNAHNRNNKKLSSRIKLFLFSGVLLFGGYHIMQFESNKTNNQNHNIALPKISKDDKINFNFDCHLYEFDHKDLHSVLNTRMQIQELQKNLRTIGYDVGTIDGIIGPQTIDQCNKFKAEFCNLFEIQTIDQLVSLVQSNAEIAVAFPTWLKIVRDSSLQEWLLSKSLHFREEVIGVIQKNDFKNLKGALSIYYFDTYSPPVQETPISGIHWKTFNEGIAPLEIVTRDSDVNHFVKIVDVSSDDDVLKLFLRGGQKIECDLPLGSYILKYATGQQWYGERFLFGPYTTFTIADKVFEFKRQGTQFIGYTIELYKQRHGNLETSQISVFQF